MKRNYYGRRKRDHYENDSGAAYKKYKETLDKARKTSDEIERTHLYQLSEHLSLIHI